MWKCPQCETVNKEDKCVICGESNPYFPKVNLNSNGPARNSKLRSTMRSQNAADGRLDYPNLQGNGNLSNGNNRVYIQQHTAPTIDVMAQSESAYERVMIEDPVVPTEPALGHEKPEKEIVCSSSENPNSVTVNTFEEPSVDAERPNDKKTEKKKFPKWIVITIAVVAVCVGGFFGFLEIQRSRAGAAYDEGDYNKAKEIYSGISFYRDSSDEIKKCEYAEATRLLKNGKSEDAKTIFERLDGYSDSDFKLLECEYANAMNDIENDRILEACEKLLRLEQENFEDSREQIKGVISKLYDKGVDEYQAENIEEAKRCFETYVESSKRVGLSVNLEYKSYLTLIEAKQTKLKNISSLYEIIDFEDTKEVLLSDKYIISFLLGEWRDRDDNILRFQKNGEKTKHYSTLPIEGKGNYSISNGIQSHGSKEDGWIKGYKYSIVDKNTIEVYCYMNDETYKMHRQ